jgi:alkyldihydroxyacetonephosphate synthase
VSETPVRRRKFWGWGYEGDGLSDEEMGLLAGLVARRLGVSELRSAAPPALSDLRLRTPRLAPPAGIAGFSSTAPWDRAEHTLGKSFADLVRGLRREYANPPDLVAYPESEEQVTAVLDWASDAGGPRSPTEAARRSSAGSSPTSAKAIGGRCRSTCGAWAGFSRSTTRRGPR